MTRNSLQFSLTWKLAALLTVAATAALFSLYIHAQGAETVSGGNGLVHKILAEFFFDLAWTVPVVIAAVAECRRMGAASGPKTACRCFRKGSSSCAGSCTSSTRQFSAARRDPSTG